MYERYEKKSLSICRVVFNAKLKDYGVYKFLLKEYNNLKFSKPMCIDKVEKKNINPKRLQRKIKKETEGRGIGTKAQIAI